MALQTGDLTWNGRAVEAAINRAAIRGLTLAGEHILTESRKIVPLDEATLEQSGTVIPDPHELSVAIVYDTPYAVAQHENLDFRHAPGRSAKYLEGPLNTERRVALRIIATEIRRATR